MGVDLVDTNRERAAAEQRHAPLILTRPPVNLGHDPLTGTDVLRTSQRP